MGGRRLLLGALLGAAAALLLARVLAHVYTDYLWFAALGAADVWRAKYASLALLRTFCAVVATLFVFANLYAVRQSVVSLVLPRRIGNIDIGEEVPRPQLTYTAAALSAAIGLAFAWSRQDWSAFLAARIGQPFGESDPYFAEDLGFFVHQLPFELSLFNWAFVVVNTVIGLVIVLYALTPSLRWEQGGLYVSGYVRRHIVMLAGVLLLMLSWHYRLEMYTVLGAGTATDGAFTFVDHRVSIPASLVLSLVTLGAGLTVLWAGWTGQLRLAFAALTGVIVVALAGRQLAPFIAMRAVANRDPLTREQPYQAIRASYTRRAFAVDRIVLADSSLTFRSLAQAAPYVPIWDDGALPRPAGTRGLYVAGWQAEDSAIVVGLPHAEGSARPALFLATTAEDNGSAARVPAGDGSTPAILVVADSGARPIAVSDSLGRIAAPALGSRLARFAYALSMQDFRVWLSPTSLPTPRIVSRRSVRERISALAPFFAQGATISPLWSNDTLTWAVELYSTSRTYPLSRRMTVAGEERAYFQHAATALVNASSGRTTLVADSLHDAVAATWMARFPRLFTRPSALRPAIRDHMPPARDGARAQAMAYGRYGSRGGELDDVPRHVPDDEGPDSALVDTPAPLMAFPRARTTGYVLPLLDRSERVRGLFVGLGGPAHRSLWLPIGDNGPLWSEGLDRLRTADTATAPILVRGHVRAVYAGGRIVLIQPRFDWRSASAPHVLYVVAVLGDSLKTARNVMQLAGRVPSAAPVSSADFRTRVRALYDEMRRAAARGDWGTYGRAFDALGALLRQPPRR